MDRKLSFESLASWSPSVGYAFLCISVRLCQLMLPGSLLFSFLLLVHSEPSPVSWLSVITLSKEPGPRFTSQSHYFLFSLPVILRHFPDLRNERRKRKSNSGSPFFRLAEIRVGGVWQVLWESSSPIWVQYTPLYAAKQAFEAVYTGALWVEWKSFISPGRVTRGSTKAFHTG